MVGFQPFDHTDIVRQCLRFYTETSFDRAYNVFNVLHFVRSKSREEAPEQKPFLMIFPLFSFFFLLSFCLQVTHGNLSVRIAMAAWELSSLIMGYVKHNEQIRLIMWVINPSFKLSFKCLCV